MIIKPLCLILLITTLLSNCYSQSKQKSLVGNWALLNQVSVDNSDILFDNLPFDSLASLCSRKQSNVEGLLVITKSHIISNIYFRLQPSLPKGSFLQLIKDSAISCLLALTKISSGLSYYATYNIKSKHSLDVNIIHSSSNDENDPKQSRLYKLNNKGELILMKKYLIGTQIRYYVAHWKKIG